MIPRFLRSRPFWSGVADGFAPWRNTSAPRWFTHIMSAVLALAALAWVLAFLRFLPGGDN